jgi:L-lactate dehydrogenase complex protein LldG
VSAVEEFAELLLEFRGKAEPLGVIVNQVADVGAAARAIAEWAALLEVGRVVIAPMLSEAVPEIGTAIGDLGLEVAPGRSPRETRDAILGASFARMAVAETGSVLLAERTLADRAVSMLTLNHAIVCAKSALAATLDDTVETLVSLALAPEGSFVTLITGPSRTADIERVLTVGVQGPGKVMVIFVDDL